MSKEQRAWNKILGADEVIVPEVIVKAAEAGLDIFEVEYISPAQRFMQAEKLQGILTVNDFLANGGAQNFPGIGDNYDADKVAKLVADFGGAPIEMMRTSDQVKKVRADAAKAAAAQAKLELAKGTAEVARTTAQAQASLNGGGTK